MNKGAQASLLNLDSFCGCMTMNALPAESVDLIFADPPKSVAGDCIVRSLSRFAVRWWTSFPALRLDKY